MLPEEEVTALGEDVVEIFRCVTQNRCLPAKIHGAFWKLWNASCRQVDGLRMRIAGKSIPTEKFAAKKAQRYNSPNPTKLPVPALVRKLLLASCFWIIFSNICPASPQEMLYVWNGFTVVGKRPGLTQNILATLEEADEQLKNDPSKISFKTFSFPHTLLCTGVKIATCYSTSRPHRVSP